MDANNSWWVNELLATNCEKAWLHPGWEDTLLRRYNWLYEMTKRRKRMEAPKVDQSYDQECRRRNKLVTQDHEATRQTDRLTD